MKLSDEMRANCPAPENHNCSCGWHHYANEVARLERVVEVTRVQNSIWHSPIVTEALKELEE